MQKTFRFRCHGCGKSNKVDVRLLVNTHLQIIKDAVARYIDQTKASDRKGSVKALGDLIRIYDMLNSFESELKGQF